jgi:hypothetical protein
MSKFIMLDSSSASVSPQVALSLSTLAARSKPSPLPQVAWTPNAPDLSLNSSSGSLFLGARGGVEHADREGAAAAEGAGQGQVDHLALGVRAVPGDAVEQQAPGLSARPLKRAAPDEIRVLAAEVELAHPEEQVGVFAVLPVQRALATSAAQLVRIVVRIADAEFDEVLLVDDPVRPGIELCRGFHERRTAHRGMRRLTGQAGERPWPPMPTISKARKPRTATDINMIWTLLVWSRSSVQRRAGRH